MQKYAVVGTTDEPGGWANPAGTTDWHVVTFEAKDDSSAARKAPDMMRKQASFVKNLELYKKLDVQLSENVVGADNQQGSYRSKV